MDVVSKVIGAIIAYKETHEYSYFIYKPIYTKPHEPPSTLTSPKKPLSTDVPQAQRSCKVVPLLCRPNTSALCSLVKSLKDIRVFGFLRSAVNPTGHRCLLGPEE